MKKFHARMMDDFWEFYDESAEIVADVLGVTLTEHEGHKLAKVPQHSDGEYLAKLADAGYHVDKTAMLCYVAPTRVLISIGGESIPYSSYRARFKPIQPPHRIYVRADGWSIAAATHDLSNWTELDDAVQKLWDYKGFWVRHSWIDDPDRGLQTVYRWVSLIQAEVGE